MKLTREQALNETIELFEKLAKKAREGKAMCKREIPGPWQHYECNCPCCEYDGQFLDDDCLHCPMEGYWITKRCMREKSPFIKWQRFVTDKEISHTIPCCIDIEFFCLLIADLAREAKNDAQEIS